MPPGQSSWKRRPGTRAAFANPPQRREAMQKTALSASGDRETVSNQIINL